MSTLFKEMNILWLTDKFRPWCHTADSYPSHQVRNTYILHIQTSAHIRKCSQYIGHSFRLSYSRGICKFLKTVQRKERLVQPWWSWLYFSPKSGHLCWRPTIAFVASCRWRTFARFAVGEVVVTGSALAALPSNNVFPAGALPAELLAVEVDRAAGVASAFQRTVVVSRGQCKHRVSAKTWTKQRHTLTLLPSAFHSFNKR